VFTSSEWKRRFDIIGSYPGYSSNSGSFHDPGFNDYRSENKTRVDFDPWTFNPGSMETHKVNNNAPFRVLLSIIDKNPEYRGFEGRPLVSFEPNFELYKGYYPTVQVKGLGIYELPRSEGKKSIGGVDVQTNDYDVPSVEKKSMDVYLEQLQNLADYPGMGNYTRLANLLIQILKGELTYEEAVDHVSKDLNDIIKEDDWNIMKSLSKDYVAKILALRGYTSGEGRSIADLHDIGIF
jgi:hypothetical protein